MSAQNHTLLKESTLCHNLHLVTLHPFCHLQLPCLSEETSSFPFLLSDLHPLFRSVCSQKHLQTEYLDHFVLNQNFEEFCFCLSLETTFSAVLQEPEAGRC